jgi:hypothetical protein
MPYLNNPNGTITQQNSVYDDTVALQPGKTVKTVTLPSVSNMNIFTLAIG